MLLPIVAFGDPVLRKKGSEVKPGHPGLGKLIADMYETMEEASGVGLAAPQVGHSIRLFITDGTVLGDQDESARDFRQVFINPVVKPLQEEEWSYNEGCLSIPGIREDVVRPEAIHVSFYDEKFTFHEKTFSGIPARIILHEYDHIEGVLFIDRLSALRRSLLKKKLIDISKGKVDVDYKMRFPVKG